MHPYIISAAIALTLSCLFKISFEVYRIRKLLEK